MDPQSAGCQGDGGGDAGDNTGDRSACQDDLLVVVMQSSWFLHQRDLRRTQYRESTDVLMPSLGRESRGNQLIGRYKIKTDSRAGARSAC